MRILFLVALFCLVCYCSVLRGARMAAASGVGADSLLGPMDDTLAWAERERQREQSRRLRAGYASRILHETVQGLAIICGHWGRVLTPRVSR